MKGVFILALLLGTSFGCFAPLPTSRVGFGCAKDSDCDSVNGICVANVCGIKGAIPTALTTGVPSGVTLTPTQGDQFLDQDGGVYDGLDITGCVTITANGVTLRRSRISCDKNGVRVSGTGAKLENVEIDGLDGGGTGLSGDGDLTAEAVNIHGQMLGAWPSSNWTIEHSYIHDLVGTGGNAILFTDGDNLLINNDHVDISPQKTACLLISSQDGPIDNVSVTDSLLNGGQYIAIIGATDAGATTHISVTDNRIGRDSGVGTFEVSVSVYFNGNVWEDTNAPVP